MSDAAGIEVETEGDSHADVRVDGELVASVDLTAGGDRYAVTVVDADAEAEGEAVRFHYKR